MERTPFNKNVSLRAYINKGKDLNIRLGDLSLIEHFLKQSSHDDTTYYTLTRLVAHPDCVVDKDKIQSLLYKNFYNFKFGAIKTEEQKAAFINRFDLTNNILIDPNNGSYPRENKFSIGWLQFFLLGEHTSHLFDWAEKYHPQYHEGLKAVDDIKFNVWHTLVNTVYNMPDKVESFNYIHEKLQILFADYPEGIYHKNMWAETPYEMMLRISQMFQNSSNETGKKILNLLQFFQLQLEVKERPESHIVTKIKI